MSTASELIAAATRKLAQYTGPDSSQRKWAAPLVEALAALGKHAEFLDQEVNSGIRSLVDFLGRLANPNTQAAALGTIDTMTVDQILEAQKHSNERVMEIARRAADRRAMWQSIISDLGTVGLRVAVAALGMVI